MIDENEIGGVPAPAPARRDVPEAMKPHQFKPGQSGNPSGRPKGRSITARLRALLEKGEINGQPIKDGKQVADMLAEVILKGALKGDFRFAKEILDRTEGKVPDKVDVTSNGNALGDADFARLKADDLDSLESIAQKLAGGPRDAAEAGPGGEVPA